MKNFTAIVAAAALLTLPLSSMAQINFLKAIPGLGGGEASADSAGQGNTLVTGFVAANKEVLMANSLMAEALGLKEEAATLKATSDALTDGATKGNLEDASKAVSTSTDAVAAAMAKQPKLDAASKAKYQAGVGRLGTGMLRYIALRGPAASFSTSIKTVNPLMLTKLQSGMYVMTQLPTSISNLSTSLQNATAFSKSNDIPVPPDATKALAAL
jgi:hypothetical protein